MSRSAWSTQRIRDLLKISRSLYEKQNNVVTIAATGSGKTLSFWIPLLMALEDKQDKFIIVVTPLNILGRQNAETLTAAGISAVSDIEAGKHQVVVINPEILMREGGHCEKLWKKSAFTSRLLYFVFDEGHCVSEWSSFWEQYKYVGNLRFLIPDTIPFYIASTTLLSPVLSDITDSLNLQSKCTDHIFRSNDRPDIAISVRKMQHAVNTFKDFNALILDNFQEGDPPSLKFLIFFDSIKEAEVAVRHLRSRLPDTLRSKIKYFHSIMSDDYRNDEYEALKNSDIFGLCVTDSFGMGLDLPDVRLVVQWKVPISMNMLWQRFGRAARGDGIEGYAILIAEKAHWDDELEKREHRKAQRQANAKKRKRKTTTMQKRPAKQARTGDVQASHSSVVIVPDEPNQNSSSDTALNLEARRSLYAKRANRGIGAVGKELKVLSPTMLDFTNAESRGFQCRRMPITLLYSNDQRVMKRSAIKAYIPGDTESELRTRLLNWRDEQMEKKFGRALFMNYGSGLLLPETSIQRVIDCAQAGKLRT
ncbi:P-loop containing nucleoside triphosphate hydrolase protein [Obba rivulosa]|uniref:DNA 3'-5' helicase n=1 Tax=Obba rivulosa TaxID=1052685 RepID=A0A8E2AQ93_9APHY|nr:P-loop containing nucleoside triphosphate hydrolase protein [Obba rivulosa]